jgi:hypothetical protein
MKTIVIAIGLLVSAAALAQQGGDRDNDRRSDLQVHRHHHDNGTQPTVPRSYVPKAGAPDPYAPKVGAPDPYATRGGDPNPYATKAGDPNAGQIQPPTGGTRRR